MHRCLLSHTGLVLLACAMATSCVSTPVDRLQAMSPSSVQHAGPAIAGLRQPLPGLYTTGQPSPDAWREIAGQGVRVVINLRPDAELAGRDEAAEVRAAGMAYHQIPVATAADLNQDNAARLRKLLNDIDGPVLVHCASGNRVGGLLALAAVQAGVGADASLELGRAAGMRSTEKAVRERLDLPQP